MVAPLPPAADIRTTGFLSRWPWYLALSAEHRQLLGSTIVERRTVAGEYIARAGEPCLHWYGIVSGFLQMYVSGADGTETTLYCVGDGRWCGEGSLLKKELRRYDLRSLTASHFYMVPAETFELLRQRSIAFNHFLCEIMNERMGVFVGMLEASRLLSPAMRVARGLLMLASEHAGAAQTLSIPQHELGLICGLSRQRVNAALRELRRHGLVHNEFHGADLLVRLPQLRAYLMAGSDTEAGCEGGSSAASSKASRSPPQKISPR